MPGATQMDEGMVADLIEHMESKPNARSWHVCKKTCLKCKNRDDAPEHDQIKLITEKFVLVEDGLFGLWYGKLPVIPTGARGDNILVNAIIETLLSLRSKPMRSKKKKSSSADIAKEIEQVREKCYKLVSRQFYFFKNRDRISRLFPAALRHADVQADLDETFQAQNELTEKVEDLSDAQADLQNQVNSLSGAQDGLQEEMDYLADVQTDLQGQADHLVDAQENLEQHVDILQEQADKTIVGVVSLSDQVEKLAEKTAIAMEGQRKRTSNNESQIDQIQKDLDKLRAMIRSSPSFTEAAYISDNGSASEDAPVAKKRAPRPLKDFNSKLPSFQTKKRRVLKDGE